MVKLVDYQEVGQVLSVETEGNYQGVKQSLSKAAAGLTCYSVKRFGQ